jgi:hypothetical protein
MTLGDRFEGSWKRTAGTIGMDSGQQRFMDMASNTKDPAGFSGEIFVGNLGSIILPQRATLIQVLLLSSFSRDCVFP